MTHHNNTLNKIYALMFYMALVLLTFILPSAYADDGQSNKVRIFSAGSTINAVTDICNLFIEKKMGEITPSFAASSTLAKQIDQGAPADIYLSANPKWMDFLEKNNMLEPGTRFDLLGNRIVLIAPLNSTMTITIDKGFDLAGVLGDEKLAMGDPDHVPAGIYGKQALESLGVWDSVTLKVARSKDVRAALALVERAEAPLGIVYSTDAAISKKVKVVGVFPEESHPPIIYPVALVAGNATPSARSFMEFLKGEDAKAIFEKYGFNVR
ncbi:molybdate transporter subunit; periplasmic-binding component of ABC superfamily [Desulfamplus magnetovallimortis]|uniref:Molybdate transporter subunit periplasmic-binding component of ABC superfamily n=1 Tax=Desulfamplus magnetovallimortis TaxID=1246637 RepID=A0A1W1H6S5_9BACT|nr:molybdate ABC transporter substrate-binding protein [Desulfamplus magnetovallimortis]SLM28085.1 molybdate transporter subunit; periplasmic-binding component of ABC superfamily [Desulfamplus magnetovallimortis]